MLILIGYILMATGSALLVFSLLGFKLGFGLICLYVYIKSCGRIPEIFDSVFLNKYD